MKISKDEILLQYKNALEIVSECPIETMTTIEQYKQSLELVRRLASTTLNVYPWGKSNADSM